MSGSIAVTGAGGFVGRPLCAALRERGCEVLEVHRREPADTGMHARRVVSGDLEGVTDWSPLVSGVESIVHLAARVHEMGLAASDERAYDAVNRDVTLALARAAAAAGVRRFVFVSTIKVNGEETRGTPFRADDTPRPLDPYARSKLRAEEGLAAVARETGLAVTIIRPPLVYGAGVGGNFLRMLDIVRRRVPVPIGAVRNRRSMVNVWNLCDLIARCVTDERAAACRTLLVADGEDVSTPDLLQRIARHMGARLWLPPVPVPLLGAIAGALGRAADVHRLTSSLQVDIEPTRRALDWRPTCPLDEGLRRTVEWFEAA
jgi:nucleoside-diphosphate-sugar epimerase